MIVALPREVPPVSAIRGTLLSASLASVRERGLLDTYFERLPAAHRDAVRDHVPLSWVPVEHALAHYGVLDELIPSAQEQVLLGRGTADRVQRSYLKTLVTALRASGALTPLTLLAKVDRLWTRSFQGGAAGVWQTGPKDARVECHGIALVRHRYFRNGWQGAFEGGLELVTRKAYVQQLRASQNETTMAFGVSWV